MTTGQRAVESVQSFANRFAAGVGWKTSPSVLHDALQPWVEAIRAAERAPLEARIASLEGDIRFLLGQADRHNIEMCKAQDDKDAALARAQRAENDAKEWEAIARRLQDVLTEHGGPNMVIATFRVVGNATHRTATGENP